MDLSNLTEKLSEFGTVQIIKAEYVFTLLMTGDNLAKSSVQGAIIDLVLKTVGNKYRAVEAFRNDTNFHCMVLKP